MNELSIRLGMATQAMLAAALAAPVAGQVTSRVSVSSSGVQADDSSSFSTFAGTQVSADGRYVAFASWASNLVPGDTNDLVDVFVRDRQTGITERTSVHTGGQQGDDQSGLYGLSMSADGRYVAFTSFATNLVPGDANGSTDVFVRDVPGGTTERVSVDSGGAEATDDSFYPAISADGRYVAFLSYAPNLVPGDTNGTCDVFVRDRQGGTTERASVDSGGAEGNDSSDRLFPSISADGRYVAFNSLASNLVPGDTNAVSDIFVRDRQSGTTERASVDSGGAQANSGCYYGTGISADGRYVAFASFATNLVPGDTNLSWDVFVRDRQSSTTVRASVDSGGAEGNQDGLYPSVSADGRYVAFHTYASNLVPGDTNGLWDVFVRDLQNGTTERASVDSSGTQANHWSQYSSLSADGRFVAFASGASNLVQGDTNGMWDVFLRDRAHGGFVSLCDPGVAGVIGCPCSNPPAGQNQGCNNSAATGGASLSASGGEYLSSDSLVFTTSGEKPTALSIVLQGNASLPAGLVYGQGVRCVGGSLKRLYTKSASGGSITAPDFDLGDLMVHSISAMLGDPISAGSTRWYMVYYRDPIVLGGCPAASTFNSTQTRAVPWLP